MISKSTNALLAIAIAVLVVLVVRANQKGQQLKLEHDRLAQRYGALTVTDETQFHVVYTPSENPTRQFRWRLYHPNLPNGLGVLRRFNGQSPRGSFGTFSVVAGEALAFANFRVRNGKPELYVSFQGASTVFPFPKEIRKFVANHWDELDFDILAETEASVTSPTEALPLLVVKIPEPLRDELPVSTPIFELFVGDINLLDNMP